MATAVDLGEKQAQEACRMWSRSRRLLAFWAAWKIPPRRPQPRRRMRRRRRTGSEEAGSRARHQRKRRPPRPSLLVCAMTPVPLGATGEPGPLAKKPHYRVSLRSSRCGLSLARSRLQGRRLGQRRGSQVQNPARRTHCPPEPPRKPLPSSLSEPRRGCGRPSGLPPNRALAAAAPSARIDCPRMRLSAEGRLPKAGAGLSSSRGRSDAPRPLAACGGCRPRARRRPRLRCPDRILPFTRDGGRPGARGQPQRQHQRRRRGALRPREQEAEED